MSVFDQLKPYHVSKARMAELQLNSRSPTGRQMPILFLFSLLCLKQLRQFLLKKSHASRDFRLGLRQ